MADDRLIVALDVATMEQLKNLVTTLGDSVSYYKVGMELFYAAGAETVTYLQEQGKSVFLDLKLHDIPNTVAQGVTSLTHLGAKLITLHSQGGPVMMAAAAKAATEAAEKLQVERPKLLAVTVLTSFDDDAWTAIGGQLPIRDQVIRLAKLAKESGMDGVVAPRWKPRHPRSVRRGFPHRNARHSSEFCGRQRPEAHRYAKECVNRRCLETRNRSTNYQSRQSAGSGSFNC